MNEPTCKSCYWYSVCPERSRLYPCREFNDTRRESGRKDKPHATERAGVLPELPVLLPVLGTQPEYGLHQLAEVYISKT